MKSFTLLTFLLFIGVGYTVAQSNYTFQLDSISITSRFKKPSGLNDKIEYKSHLPELLNQLKDNPPKVEQPHVSVDKLHVTGTNNSIPCYQPKGSFPMMICEPDTTLKYSLLIKKE